MSIVALAVFVGLLVAAAFSDGTRYVIPNWIVAALILGFLISVAGGLLHVALWPHIAAAAGVLAIGTGIFALGLMGGGDVKLWSAVALWLGPDLLWTHLILVALLGGGIGIVLLISRRLHPAATVRGSFVPYGIPIAIGALLLLPRLAAATL